MTRILGLSGKKQSGKNTASSFLHGMEMLGLAIVPEFQLNDKGKLIVPVEGDGGDIQGAILDLETKTDEFAAYMGRNVWPFIKAYSFADVLKETVCMQVLGLTREQCYGTDEQKNSDTHIKWGDLPTPNENLKNKNLTAREVMQYVGTDFFRKLYPNVWVDSTIKKIEREGTEMAVITDVRFPNEVTCIQEKGGRVIRLTRDLSSGEDQHPSQFVLDDYEGFDLVVDNRDLTALETSEIIYKHLREWGWASTEIE